MNVLLLLDNTSARMPRCGVGMGTENSTGYGHPAALLLKSTLVRCILFVV